MGRRKLKFVLPRLNDCGGKLNASWYIEYSFRDEKIDKLERFRIYEGFSSLTTVEERYKHAKVIIDDLTRRIASGWTPFDQLVTYDNQILYHNQAKVYGRRNTSEKDLHYYINLFLNDKIPQISEKSGMEYKSKLRLFHQWLDAKGYQNIFAHEITNDHICDYILFLIKERSLEKRTILKTKQHLRQLFDFIVNKKIIDKNPVYNIPDARQSADHSAQPMSQHEASVLMNHIKKNDTQVWLFCSMLFYCAIRPGTELRLLKVKDINFINETIRIREENAKGSEGFVNIPPPLMTILRDLNISANDREFYVFGKSGEPGTQCWGKNHFRVQFNKFRDDLKYPKEYKLYSWKSTGAILFLQSGAPLTAVRDHLRHKSTAYTDIYVSKLIGRQNNYVKNDFPEL
ncbi:MAG: tyrosine-type recombinase/integrase [Dysgonomonas sp.]